MKKKQILIACALMVLVTGQNAVRPALAEFEEPGYKTLSTEPGNIEIRAYAPMVIAEVSVGGERKPAIRQGFRLLADYIFGKNRPATENAEKQKIAMTAPVQQQGQDESWKVRFVMPSEYSVSTLPEPVNKAVILRELPAKKYIAIRFSGFSSQRNIARHEALLMRHIAEKNIKVTGHPIYAFYNPPWTLPFLRRNEIMAELAK